MSTSVPGGRGGGTDPGRPEPAGADGGGGDEGRLFGAAPEQARSSGMTESQLEPAPGGSDAGGSMLRPSAPVRHVGPPPGDPPGGAPGETGHPTPGAARIGYEIVPGGHDPVEMRRAERRVALVFLVSTLSTLGFLMAYVFMKVHTPSYGSVQNYTLGLTLALALFTLGAGQILWAKDLIPKEYAIQDRHDGPSPEPERVGMEEDFFSGAERLGIGTHKLARRSLLLAAGIFPIPALFLLRDLGPAPQTRLRHTLWAKGDRLVDVETKQPIRIGDLQVGAIATVLPEGYDKHPQEDWALAPTILIRTRPGILKPPTKLNWTVDGHIAYSKVCTHAGCPTSLYEQQTQHLLCPCHQSTFVVSEGCKVIFGPAARPLPQLPIALDANGYFVAQSDYREPVGPSFWERGAS